VIGFLLAAVLALIGALIRPGTNVVIQDQPTPRSVPTDVGTWFVCGITEKGFANTPVRIESIAQYITTFGQRVAYGVLYDCLDAFFREGGRAAYVSRVVGPGAVSAFKNLVDNVAAVSLVVTARGPGAWGNGLKVAVIAGGAGGTFQIQIADANNVVLEQSGDLSTQADAVNWSAGSQYVMITLGASALIPANAALAALATGTDDRTNITDAQWQAALDAISPDLGPGQVSMPGRTILAAQTALLAHAQARNRRALVDLADSGSRATLVTAAIALRGASARCAAAFSPWAVIPGILGGTTRTIPYSAIQAGIIARNDGSGMSPDDPAAGDAGQSNYAIDLSQPAWSDADRQLLNEAGVNVAVRKYGGIRTYGYRTLVNPTTDPVWVGFGGSRLVMAYAARGDEILERHIFDKIDGNGFLFGVIHGELAAIANEYYGDGSLYGATPEQAFLIDVGTQVNTPQTIANRELHAKVNLKISEMAEMVELDLIKVAVTDEV
jgi:hypothetical protein